MTAVEIETLLTAGAGLLATAWAIRLIYKLILRS